MTDFLEISASIVLYNEDAKSLEKTIDSFLKIPLKKKLFLIDNSPTNVLKSYFINDEIEFIFVGKNIGFGRAHNLVLNKLNSSYHLILNPDVVFEIEIIKNQCLDMNNKSDKQLYETLYNLI